MSLDDMDLKVESEMKRVQQLDFQAVMEVVAHAEEVAKAEEVALITNHKVGISKRLYRRRRYRPMMEAVSWALLGYAGRGGQMRNM